MLKRFAQQFESYFSSPYMARAVGWSVFLHIVLLAISFVPEETKAAWDSSALKIVLLNDAAASAANEAAKALAQANNAGGGEHDSGLVSSPTEAADKAQDGSAVADLQKQVQNLEKEQAALLAQLKLTTDKTQIDRGASIKPNPVFGREAQNTEQALQRDLAAIEKRVNDYNSRPKRKQISPDTKEVFFAKYYAQWSERIERLGSENYPPQASGRAGDVIVTVSIKPNGTIDELKVMRSSGNKQLDRAALLLLKQLSPYQAFDKAVKERLDILDLTTRIIFNPAQTSIMAEAVR